MLQVFQVRKKDTGAVFAMKVIRKNTIRKPTHITHMMSENNILKTIKSPFLCKLHFAFQTPSKLYLVLEFLAGSDFHSFLVLHTQLKEEDAIFYIAEIVIALDHLHQRGVIYRDLKPENIMIDKEGHLKLTDFGLCKENMFGAMETRSFCGTLDFMAPEICSKQSYGKAVDWWALGVLFYDAVVGENPFNDRTNNRLQKFENIVNKVVVPPGYLTKEARSLIKGLLDKNKEERLGARLGAAEIKAHQFFRGVDWQKAEARELTPPFTPQIGDDTDTCLFERSTTQKPAVDSEGEMFEYTGENPFHGFSYVSTSEYGN